MILGAMPGAPSTVVPGSLPLHDVRILDLTHVWSGPMATKVLAGLGAEVLKVEAPHRPDFLRGSGPADLPGRYPDFEPGPESHNRNAWFNAQNTDKRSVVLDVKDERGRAAFLSLVREADVVVNNFRPGALSRLGLDVDVLTGVRPDLIVVDMPGYSSTSSSAALAGYGAQFEARSGSARIMGSADTPVLTGFALADPIAGLAAASAIVTALARRARTGQGAHIEVVQSESMLPMIGEFLLGESLGLDPDVDLNRDPAAWWESIVELADGSWLSVRIDTPDQAARVQALLGEDSADAGPAAADPAVIERLCAARTDAEATARLLQSHGIAAAPVRDLAQVFADPGLRDVGFYVPLHHEAVGIRDHAGFPATLAGVRPAPRKAAPRLGEHTREVLLDDAGLAPEEVDALADAGVIRTE